MHHKQAFHIHEEKRLCHSENVVKCVVRTAGPVETMASQTNVENCIEEQSMVFPSEKVFSKLKNWLIGLPLDDVYHL